jgi:hypothetical protein
MRKVSDEELARMRQEHPVSEGDRAQYVAVLREIKVRIEAALQAIANPRHVLEIEHAALNLRMVLELVVLSSLVTNRSAIEAVASALHRKDAAEARKLAKRANPGYWPVPVKQVELSEKAPRQFRLEPVDRPYVRENEWGREFGRTSALLHSRNPLEPARDITVAANELRDLAQRLITLLDHHEIHLADRESMVVAGMQTKETGDVQVGLFTRLQEGSGEAEPD